MSKLFIEKRISKAITVTPGSGDVTIDIPFVPEYIKVNFLDADHTFGNDSLSYDLAYVGDSSDEFKYQMVISWEVAGSKTRRFRYTVAKLSSFHFGSL